ncbi:restriction endonuclease, partial [Flavobacteriaceae bacterium]|nr:restriction endonuclease [Flavobacteriaceae bacterium]
MPGKPKDKLKYLESIDEFDFPYLIADILSSHFNHYNVRVVDGTGDGKRDVFSINRKGEKVVTQCKYHYDMGKTSGTRETDEIAIALNKFKCNIGFFCTSGKLSPQSKREYLDNYPDFELNWLEGHEIVDIVLEDTILRKIWFENEKIHLTKSCVSIPFIFRKLPDDSSLEPVISYDFKLPNEIRVVVKEKSLFSPNQFRPFNDLDIRKSGGSFGNTFAFEIKLAGKINYNSIDDIKTQIVEQVSKESTLQFPDSYVAIRFGIPHLSEENDSFRKYKVEKSNFPINSETYLIKDGQIQEEYDFLIETGDDWKRPYRISMSQLSDFRFYNRDLDLVFNMYYTCAAKEDLHPHVTRNIEIEKILWKKSIFVSGERNIIEEFTELPA